jgi:signal peptidase I
MRIEDDDYWHSAQRLPYLSDLDNDDILSEDRRASRPHVLREVAETIVVTLLIFFVVRAVVQNFKVEGDSMLPTLHTEQYLLVNKGLYFRYDANFLAQLTNPDIQPDMRYLFHGPQRGDIVVFEAWNEQRDFIKRVIAVAGETVEVKADPSTIGDPGRDCGDCGVYVNGVRLVEPYVNQTPDYSTPPTVVPPDHVFVLGDNRRNSSDSHVPSNGPLDVNRIIGTAFVTYWPQDRWGFLPHPTYAEIKKSP